ADLAEGVRVRARADRDAARLRPRHGPPGQNMEVDPRVEPLDRVDQVADFPEEAGPAPLPRGERVGDVDEPALIVDPRARLAGGRALRDALRQEEADDVDGLPRPDLFAHDDPVRTT